MTLNGLLAVDVHVENNYRSRVTNKGASAVPRQDPVAVEPPARVTSESLLGARGELLIVHNGREYRLRLTQNGKLILTA
jgi:hemin uptake protein HemP